MTTDLAPSGKTITFEIKDASLLAGTWILSSYLKGVDKNIIEDIKIIKISKGENSISFLIFVTFVSEVFVKEIISDTIYLLTGKLEETEAKPKPGLIWEIIERAARYIVKKKASSMNVNGKEVIEAVMNPKVRDRLLESDYKELRRLK